ncbi:hypothetical protein EV128_103196 [Rhizobium azibense]|nr:hypothetical protein EV128_103196 [Rhizobium azibense]
MDWELAIERLIGLAWLTLCGTCIFIAAKKHAQGHTLEMWGMIFVALVMAIMFAEVIKEDGAIAPEGDFGGLNPN